MLLEVYLNYETSCLLSVGKLVGRSVIISKKQESGIYTSMLPSEHLLESIFSIYTLGFPTANGNLLPLYDRKTRGQ